MYKALFFFLFFTLPLFSVENFEGRISELTEKASLMRIKFKNFKNLKFLSTKNKVTFWNESYPSHKCTGEVKGKTNEYLLLQVEGYLDCVKKVYLTKGSSLLFSSDDLETNKKKAQEVIDLLLKKRLAVSSQLEEKRTHGGEGAISAINEIYQAKIAEIEAQWANEIEKVKASNQIGEKDILLLQTRLEEIDHELERYRINDKENAKDRWALDEKIYPDPKK
ncbi:MAG: hypothetical protein KBD63_01360 [Bacteriovoracaceae bacterium]|nr:hypothetical protein [Bacteriovoracaceae bacterium]